MSDFCSWWVNLNSPTCSILNNGWPSPGTEDGGIEINKLHVPGKNGCLSLLFVLMVWRKLVGDGNTAEWDDAILDVNWVTLCLIKLIWYTPSIEVIPTLKRYV